MTRQTTHRLHDEFKELALVLREATTATDKGVDIDLAGLDAQVDRLCQATITLPPVEAKRLIHDMEALIRGLNVLEGALARHRDALAAAVDGRPDPHTARRQATAAYARAPGSGPVAGDDLPVRPASEDAT